MSCAAGSIGLPAAERRAFQTEASGAEKRIYGGCCLTGIDIDALFIW